MSLLLMKGRILHMVLKDLLVDVEQLYNSYTISFYNLFHYLPNLIHPNNIEF